MTIVAVGKNSFLAQNIRHHADTSTWTWLTHKEALSAPNALHAASVLINFAFSPDLVKGPYDPLQDLDSHLAEMIQAQNTHFVMLGTRMVYGQPSHTRGFREDDTLVPDNVYGRNKKIIEETLRDILPANRLTILRLSNVFGYEPGRSTFFGTALQNLALHKTITFDIAPDSIRDFLPARLFAERIDKIVRNPVSGTYNIGCGFGVECGDIARWIIEGYGDGELVVTGTSRKGEFYLDTGKAMRTFDLPPVTKEDILQACLDCGQRLIAFA